MTKYRIVAARPKNTDHDLNSQFKLFVWDEKKSSWSFLGWKSTIDVGNLLHAGHEVRTGKIANNKMDTGAPVELELRIAKNDTKYKISDMPED